MRIAPEPDSFSISHVVQFLRSLDRHGMADMVKQIADAESDSYRRQCELGRQIRELLDRLEKYEPSPLRENPVHGWSNE